MSNERHGPERLRVYHLALDFADRVGRVARRARCTRSQADQLIRSADSVLLNIAEGAAHITAGQKLRHYRISHASAGECKAALARIARDNPSLPLTGLHRTADMIAAMLMALIHTQEKRLHPRD